MTVAEAVLMAPDSSGSMMSTETRFVQGLSFPFVRTAHCHAPIETPLDPKFGKILAVNGDPVLYTTITRYSGGYPFEEHHSRWLVARRTLDGGIPVSCSVLPGD